MKKSEAWNMASDIVCHIDYDIWKEIYLDGHGDPEEQKKTWDALVDIIEDYIELEDDDE